MPKLDMTRARSFSPAVEDYLKAIYRLQSEVGGPVSTNALGGWLGVTAPSASGMLKKLDDLRLVGFVPYPGVRVSEAGRRGAPGGVRAERRAGAVLGQGPRRGRGAGARPLTRAVRGDSGQAG